MSMLTENQIQHFEQKVWIGPIDIFSPIEIAKVKECLENNSCIMLEANGQQIMTFYNNVLNIETPCDHHLFHEPLAEMFKNPYLGVNIGLVTPGAKPD